MDIRQAIKSEGVNRMVFRKKTGVKQHDITDCGAACLASISGFYGLNMPVSRIRQLASTDQKGTNILGMIEAAGKMGFAAKGVKGEKDSLFHLPLPAIAHVIAGKALQHFVVIYNVSRKYIEVMDPRDGKFQKLAHEEFLSQWTGVLILIMPNESFQPGNEQVSIISRLWFLLKPHRAILLQAMFGAAVFTIIGLSTAIYIQLIVDHVLPDDNRSLLNLLGVGMIVLLIAQIFIGAIKSLFTLKTGQLIDARLILGYYKHLLRLPQQFFDSMRVGEITSRIGDAVKIRAFINDVAINLLVNVFIIFFSFILMFTYYWKLGLVMLAIIPAYSVIYVITNWLNRKTQRKVMEDAADLESQLVESLNSVSTIKQFGLEDYANIRTETRFIRLLHSVYRSGLNSVFSGFASQFTSRLFTIFLLWTGSVYVLQGAITPGELLSFYAIIGYFTGPVGELIGMNKVIQDAFIAADRLFDIMDLDKEESGKKVILKRDMVGDIRFENVHFRYGSRTEVFEGLHLVIPHGKVTAFIGESGSGKTTLVNILQKLYPVDSGRVTIGKLELSHIDTHSLRQVVCVVPQKIHLFSGNVIDNIAVGEYHPNMQRIIEICKQLDILTSVEELPYGFETHLGVNGATLSGGQKQRIAIARALYRDPEILILDEATSSLDPASEGFVRETIANLRAREKTVILIAHRLSSVIHADKICVLNKGILIEQGTHATLYNQKGDYYNFWQKQLPSLNDKTN